MSSVSLKLFQTKGFLETIVWISILDQQIGEETS